MSVIRDPLRELLRLQERMNQIFEQSFSPIEVSEEVLRRSAWSPPVDIQETPDRIILRADLPGVPLEKIDLSIEKERLILKGERIPDAPVRREGFHRAERPFGRFFRTFALPPTILQSGIRAEMKNGVLEVVLPKDAAIRPRSIQVEVR